MGDSIITIIAIFLAAILMFIFPLMALSERSDDISQLSVQTATAEFVDDIRATGKLTLEKYEKYLSTLTATGNSFDVEMQIQKLDENPGVKVTQGQKDKIGENIYYSVYTSQIVVDPDNDNSTIKSGNTYKVEYSENQAGYIEKITITKNGDDSGSGGTSGRETGGKV